MRAKFIKTPLYPGYVCIIDVDTIQDLKKYELDRFFSEGEELYAHAIRFKRKDYICNYMIFNTKHLEPITPGFIAHEAVHVAGYILDDVGYKHTYDNEEPLTYLVGWLVDQAHDFLYGTKFSNKPRLK